MRLFWIWIFDLNICLECIKKKKTKHTKKGATRNTQLLEIIHTNIFVPFDIPSFGGENPLSLLSIIFYIMDISICQKKNLKWWILSKRMPMRLKDNLDRKVKTIRSDRGDEYYVKIWWIGTISRSIYKVPQGIWHICKTYYATNNSTKWCCRKAQLKVYRYGSEYDL